MSRISEIMLERRCSYTEAKRLANCEAQGSLDGSATGFVNSVEAPTTVWCSGEPPEEEGWYWMDYGMWTPIFPAFWNGHSWENSGGTRLNVEQFEKAEWQGPIFPIGREMNKSPNAPHQPRRADDVK